MVTPLVKYMRNARSRALTVIESSHFKPVTQTDQTDPSNSMIANTSSTSINNPKVKHSPALAGKSVDVGGKSRHSPVLGPADQKIGAKKGDIGGKNADLKKGNVTKVRDLVYVCMHVCMDIHAQERRPESLGS